MSQVDSYVPFLADIWAAIEPISSTEIYGASQIQSTATTRIRIRYRPGITAKMRVKVSRDRSSPDLVDYYDIEGDPIEVTTRRREIWLNCKKRSGSGFRTGPPS
jgi:SPP1 family predicted phage head-tail adaptor